MPSLVSMSIKVSMLKRSIRPRMRSAMPGEIEVILRCPPRPLLERVKNVDRLAELGDVEDAVLCARVDADLLDARPDARHRLPIVRLQAAPHSPELESGDLPGGVWKVAHYTRTWMLRRRPAAASLRYGRHPKASETPPP